MWTRENALPYRSGRVHKLWTGMDNPSGATLLPTPSPQLAPTHSHLDHIPGEK